MGAQRQRFGGSELIEEARQRVRAAPFGTAEDWRQALEATAQASGAWSAQLLGMSASAELLWNWSSGISNHVLGQFEELMADAPDLNPRTRILRCTPGLPVPDEAILREGERDANACYREFYARVEAPHAGLVRMPQTVDGSESVLATLRREQDGPPCQEDLAALAVLSREFAVALRIKRRFDAAAAEAATGAFEALGFSALFLNASGQVVAASPLADDMLRRETPLRTRRGVLQAVAPRSGEPFRKAVEAVISSDVASRVVALWGEDGVAVAEVARLPAAPPVTHQSAVVVVLVAAVVRTRPEAAAVLKTAFGLTPAESEIALGIASGLTPVEIAASRLVSPVTLRNQLRPVFAKLGVSSQSQVSSLILRRLGGRWIG